MLETEEPAHGLQRQNVKTKEAPMYRINFWLALFSMSAAFLAACVPGAPTASPFTAATSPIIVEVHPTLIITPIPSMSTKTSPADLSNLDPDATRLVEKSREHLVKKFGISSDQITVFSVQAVTWPDASLGCAQAGMSYAQAETPGYMILLEAAGKTYNYHTDARESVVLCDTQSPGEIFLPPNP